STQDGVLIARHDPNLAISTDVAQHPEFAARKRTVKVDGEEQTGWFSNDFTLAEIKTLGAISTDAQRPQEFNGRFKVATFVQLIDGDSVDLKTGAVTFGVPSDRPYDWTLAGDKRNFDVMVTPAGLAEIKTYADGIGPWKRYIVSVRGTIGADGKVVDRNGDGKINDADATTLEPTTLIADAHRAGLFVHAFTFRNEDRRLAASYGGDPK